MRLLSIISSITVTAGILYLSPTNAVSQELSERTGDPPIEIEHTFGKYTGMGIGIHDSDVLYPRAFDELKPQYVRMEFGPHWDNLENLIPSGITVEEYVAYLDSNYNGDGYDRLNNAKLTYDFLQKRGIEILKIQFELPGHWRTNDEASLFLAEHVEDLARFHTAHLLYLKKHGIKIDYIELANEPDGFWNGHIEAKDYARLVKLSDELLEEHGLEDVKILGPGLTFLHLHGWAPPYFDALEEVGVHHLDGWSTHIWDEVEFLTSRPEFTYNIWKPFAKRVSELDPEHKMPIFVSEYASEVLEYEGKRSASPRDQKDDTIVDTWPYAVRVIANSISNLNRGANALILYRLTNADWHSTGWGFVQTTGENEFKPKPVYGAVTMALSTLPKGSVALKPEWYSDEDAITLSCLLLSEEKRLEIVAANSTSELQKKTISLRPSLGEFSVVKVDAMDQSGKVETTRATVEDGKLILEMTPLAIARVSLKYTNKN